MDLWGPRPQPWDWLHICMGGRDISVCWGLKRISSGQQQLSTLSTCQEAKTLLDAAMSPSESSSNTARVCSVQSRPQTWLYVTAVGLLFSMEKRAHEPAAGPSSAAWWLIGWLIFKVCLNKQVQALGMIWGGQSSTWVTFPCSISCCLAVSCLELEHLCTALLCTVTHVLTQAAWKF